MSAPGAAPTETPVEEPVAEPEVQSPPQEAPPEAPEGGEPVIVNSKQEHDALLGIKAEPAKKVTVDIAALAQPEAVPVKRKYTKRAAIPLPANLE